MATSAYRTAIVGTFLKLALALPIFFRQFVRLAGPFWNSEQKSSIRWRSAALIFLTILQIAIAVEITEWSAGLFNALERHSKSGLWTQIWLALMILIANMTVTYWHLRIKRQIQLDWRGWLTDHLIGRWMREGRHYQVTHMPGRHDNPDGRIAEDIRIATEYAIDLCHSLLYALLLLISFTKVLWTLSGTLSVPLGLFDVPIPGYLVWLALGYAAGASYLGFRIGKPLTRATDGRQTREANFRFGLVRARENSEAIALVNGETDERRRFTELFAGIIDAWNGQTRALGQILLFTSGYSVLSLAFPVLVVAPRYIAGLITLGALVQTSQAFQQMAAALSWPVDNLAKVAEWRASVERVLGLSRALKDLDEDIRQIDPQTILVEETGQPAIVFHSLSLAEPDGLVILDKLEDTIRQGERVFLSGDPALGGKLFKVIARLWPWGCGRVELPRGETMFFVPPRPYLPIETLRAAVSYPNPSAAFDQAAVERALLRVKLDELVPRLDETNTWEKTLSREQQQRLGFARLLLCRPRWIFLQEALDSLSEEKAREMMDMLLEEFSDATIVSVTNQTEIRDFHHRQIVIQCPTCEKMLKKETVKRREQERRDREDGSVMKRLWGTLRDRRQI